MKKSSNYLKDSAVTVFLLLLSFVASLFCQKLDVEEHTTVFVFAVFLISLLTTGYIYGILAAFAGTLAVNYAFTFPYFALNFTRPVNLISAFVLIVISFLTSALTPIIVLSARSNEADKIRALDSGANDYITKPFGPGELLARVRATLRNTRFSAEEGRLPGGKFIRKEPSIDYDARRVCIKGETVKLTQAEYNIVAFLSENCGKMMTYAAIIKAIWGQYAQEGSIKKLQVNMANIRRKIGDRPGEGEHNYITNELGVGYRLNE